MKFENRIQRSRHLLTKMDKKLLNIYKHMNLMKISQQLIP